MNYTHEKEGNNYKIKIELSLEEWEKYVSLAYEETKHKYNVQGFRKGKAPRKVIEKTYGQTIFYDEAMDNAFSTEYYSILQKEKDIDPINNPDVKIESFDEKGLTFSCVVECVPDVKLGSYKDLEITKNKAKIKASDVKEELDKLRDKQARYIDASDSEAQMGDFTTIDFVGSIDGVEFPGGKAENYRLELGSKSFIDTFEEQIVGMKVGDVKDINVKFPDEYHAEELKGKPAVFKVTLEGIERKELPELNDEFASNVSEFETLEEYKKDVEKRLQTKLNEKVERELENDILEKIVAGSEVEIPNCLTERQLDMFLRDLEMRLSYQGIKLEDYAKYSNTTVEEIRSSKTEQAKDAVKTRLVLEEIIKKEEIKVSEEELDEKLKEIADKYKKTLADYKKSVGEKELQYFENDILMGKIFNFLKENNNIK